VANYGKPQPLTLRRVSAPECITALRSSPRPSFSVRHRRRPFAGLGEVLLSAALAGSRNISFCLTASHAAPGVTPCLFSTHARKSWRQAQVCLRPLVCFGQTRASRPPPHQHRVPTRAAIKNSITRIFRLASALSGLLRGLFSDRSTSHWEQAQGLILRRVRFSLTASWTYV